MAPLFHPEAADRDDGFEDARGPLLRDMGDSDDSDGEGEGDGLMNGWHAGGGRRDAKKEEGKKDLLRYLSFACAIMSCLCAGSITAYSLYGHLFLSHLRYTQMQVNIVSITAELGMYLPVPIFGYFCDRYSPSALSLLSGSFFGPGYLLAAFTYRQGPAVDAGGNGWPFWVMVVAFTMVGMGTSGMYISAVTTCAKNFGRGAHKGFALAMPIAAFGLSGMWQSQVGSRLLCERDKDGRCGDVDVFRFFIFLGALLWAVGAVGTVGLRVVDEEELIDEAVEELEASGLLEGSAFFNRQPQANGYGTLQRTFSDGAERRRMEAEEARKREEEEQRKKTWLLNEETRRFLSDHTMWWLAAGFFLVTGPGETFINNMGTIIGTLYPPTTSSSTSPATHVSIIAVTSTLARIFTGTLSDYLAPLPSHHFRRASSSLASSLNSLPPRRFSVSRLTFLLAFSLILSLGQLLLATGFADQHGERFWLVSALIGSGYGAAFSLAPIIISVVWGVENFGTNWGIVAMVPAAGATAYSILYSTIYQRNAGVGAAGASGVRGIGAFGVWGATMATGSNAGSPMESANDVLCYGKQCYALTFWIMSVSVWIACGLWIWAWRGPGGWKRRGIAV